MIGEITSLARMSFAALATSLGCPENKLNEVYAHIGNQNVALNPEVIVKQVRDAIEEVTR